MRLTAIFTVIKDFPVHLPLSNLVKGHSAQMAAHHLDIIARLHARMIGIVTAALPLITKSRSDADLIGLAHLREEMLEIIAAYRRYIYSLNTSCELLISRQKQSSINILVTNLADFENAYEEFRARWLYRDGISHWHEYRLSCVVMMKRLRLLVHDAETIRIIMLNDQDSAAYATAISA